MKKGGKDTYTFCVLSRIIIMSDMNNNNGEPLTIDFSKIIPENTPNNLDFIKEDFTDMYVGGHPATGEASFGSVATAYPNDIVGTTATVNPTPKFVNAPDTNITYLNTAIEPSTPTQEYKTAGNVFANVETTTPKPSATELQRMVQKLEKLEKMINPNSKKSLILWEEDNGFKNLISTIVNYSTTCNVDDEFPIELYDKMKALSQDVDNQIVDGKAKIVELEEQQKHNTAMGEALSNAYISATAGLPREEYEKGISGNEQLAEYKEYLATIATGAPETEEYAKAEKAIKSKISNLENSVHVTIDLERTTSKGGALEYIKKEIKPAVDRLEEAYNAKNAQETATHIDGEETITALAVKKTFAEKVYDTFVKPFARLFKRKSKAK